MKVPLETEPFAPVDLTSDQVQQLQWLSESILDETYTEYTKYAVVNQRALDKHEWKHVMSRENVSIYKRTGAGELGGSTPDVTLHKRQREPRRIHWRVPGVVGVGTLAGSLDDLLYGIVATTKTETDIRTTYIKDGAGDSRVLATVVHPTESDPLSALVVRWSLVHQLVHKLGATPRDVVNIESVGSRVLSNGERIGFVVIQSIDLPGCEPLTEKLGIIRLRFSTCYILRDVGDGSVELYMRAFLEPGGRLSENIAVFFACSSLVAVWRVLLSGQNKKLVWMMRRRGHGATRGKLPNGGHAAVADDGSPLDLFAQARDDGDGNGNNTRCPICDRSRLAGLRFHVRCDVCLAKVCTRCVEKRKLTHVVTTHSGKRRLRRVVTRVCAACLTLATRTSARAVAISEYVPWASRSADPLWRGSVASSLSLASGDLDSFRFHRAFTFTDTDTQHTDSSHSIAPLTTTTATTAMTTTTTGMNARESEDSRCSDVSRITDTTSDSDNARSSAMSFEPVKEEHEAFSGVDPTTLEMWIRWNRLRISADETSMLTRRDGPGNQ